MCALLHLLIDPAHCPISEERAEHPTRAIHKAARVFSLHAVRAFLVEFYEPWQNLFNGVNGGLKANSPRKRIDDKVCAGALISASNLIQLYDQSAGGTERDNNRIALLTLRAI